MPSKTLLPDPTFVSLEHLAADAEIVHVVVTARRETAPCLDCQYPAQRVHSRYHRTLADRPWNGLHVQLHLRTRR